MIIISRKILFIFLGMLSICSLPNQYYLDKDRLQFGLSEITQEDVRFFLTVNEYDRISIISLMTIDRRALFLSAVRTFSETDEIIHDRLSQIEHEFNIHNNASQVTAYFIDQNPIFRSIFEEGSLLSNLNDTNKQHLMCYSCEIAAVEDYIMENNNDAFIQKTGVSVFDFINKFNSKMLGLIVAAKMTNQERFVSALNEIENRQGEGCAYLFKVLFSSDCFCLKKQLTTQGNKLFNERYGQKSKSDS